MEMWPNARFFKNYSKILNLDTYFQENVVKITYPEKTIRVMYKYVSKSLVRYVLSILLQRLIIDHSSLSFSE